MRETLWTKERIEVLRQRWAENCTGLTIANELGLSRSAVLGKVTRLKLFRRDEPLKKKSEPPPRPARRLSEVTVPCYPAAVHALTTPSDTPHVTLARRSGCCFPVNDGKPYLFCNKQKQDGSSYCNDHHALMFAPRKKISGE